MISNQILDLTKEEVVSFFKEIDTRIELCSFPIGSIPRPLFHFFNELSIEKKKYARNLCFIF
jgi:hypothetical protein